MWTDNLYTLFKVVLGSERALQLGNINKSPNFATKFEIPNLLLLVVDLTLITYNF
jgi:hypothetical protein